MAILNSSLIKGKLSVTEAIYENGSSLENKYAAKSHTHTKSQITDFPTSLPASGGTADKLGTTTIGSRTKPIYLNGGVATAIPYTIAKSVPSNAVFTDTNTWRPVQNNLTSTSTTDSLSAAQGKILNEKIDSSIQSAIQATWEASY